MSFHTPKLQTRLQQATKELNLSLSDAQQHQLLSYLTELSLWNKKFNLTAITDPEQMLVKHLFDSMSILPYLPAGKLLDVGTGAGLPSVIIAICQPERHVTALDSNSKKIRFIRQVAANLQLKNLSPEHCRIEEAQSLAPFEVITSRAFSSLVDFANHCDGLLSDEGSLFAMKGVLPEDEMAELTGKWNISSQRLAVPELSDERHAVVLQLR